MSTTAEQVVSGWWYAEKGKTSGPVSDAELQRLLQAGEIDLATLGWHDGMAGWQPLGQIDSLAHLRKGMPPGLAQPSSANVAELPLATGWRRFFARTFDIWWEATVSGFLLGFLAGLFVGHPFVTWINDRGNSFLFGMLCLPIALLADAAITGIFGNTPGKALLGVKVTNPSGGDLTFDQSATRNLGLWMSGYAFGIPVIAMITMALQYRRVRHGEPAVYDEKLNLRVHARPLSALRAITFCVGFFFLALLISALRQT